MTRNRIGLRVACAALLFHASGAFGRDTPRTSEVADGIVRAQIFNGRMANPAALPNVGFVWGAVAPLKSRTIIDSFYYPNQRDLDRTHTAEWFQKNHPSWMTYECDRKTPSYGYIYSWGAYAPLDTSNSEVRQYLLKTYIEPALARGYRAIAFDNVAVVNTDKRCGVWRDGQWVQQFSGKARDAAYAQQKLDYIRWLANEIHSRGGLIALNAKIDPLQRDETRALIEIADIWVDEGGFSDSCRRKVVDDAWKFKRNLIEERGDKAYVSINYTCASFSSFPDNDELSWIIASFLVNRTDQSYLAVLPQKETGKWVENPRLDPPVGKPVEAAQAAGTLLSRSFERGYAAVNISSREPVTVDAPPGTWRDLSGQPVSGQLTLKPRSGLVLLKSGSR